MSKIKESLGIELFTIDEDNFRIAQAVKKKFQWKWKDKKLKDYSPKEIEKANLRTLCMDEVVLDLEDKESAKKTKEKLEKENIIYIAFASGSRGVHFHLKFSQLKNYPEKIRNYIRKQIILFFNADVTKAAEKTLIAIADRPHWKTGKNKHFIKGKIEDNELPSFVKTELPEAVPEEETYKEDKTEVIKEPCPALKRILEEGVKEGQRNNMRANIVLYYYIERNLSKKETIKKVLEWNSKCSPPEEETQVIKTATNTMDHAEYRIGCQSWKDYCPFYTGKEIEKHKCKWLKKYKGWLEDLAYANIPIAEQDSEEKFVNPIHPENIISRWISYMEKITDAYPEYNLGGILALLSIITKRKAVIQITPAPIFPNLWILLIGESTISRKSTCVNAIKNMGIKIQLNDYLCPDDFTPESLIKVLQIHGQKIFIQEEFEEFFGQLSKDYKAGLAGTLCKLYENVPIFSRELMSKSFLVQNVYLPILTATTIETFKGNREIDIHIKNGFFARFLYIFPKRQKKLKNMELLTKEIINEREELTAWLRDLSKLFDEIDINSPKDVTISEDALNLYHSWIAKKEKLMLTSSLKDNQLRFLGRLAPNVLKIAFLHHIGRPEYKKILRSGLDILTNYFPYHKRNSEEESLIRLTSSNSKSKTDMEKANSKIKLVNNKKLISNINNNINNNNIYYTNIGFENNEQISEVVNSNVKPFFSIGFDDIKVAIQLAEKVFIPFADRFLEEIQGTGGRAKTVYDVILRRYKKGKPVSHSDALRNSHLDAYDFKRAITTLVQAKRIRVIEEGKPKYAKIPPVFYVPLDPEKRRRNRYGAN